MLQFCHMNSLAKSTTFLLAACALALTGAAVYFSVANWQMPAASNVAVPTPGESEPAQQEAKAESGEDASDPDAGAFALDVPGDWVVTKNRNAGRDDGVRTYEWISNAEMEYPYVGSGLVLIQVQDELKDGRSFDEVAATHVWDEADVRETVEFMSGEAGDAFPNFSEEDIIIDSAEDAVNGRRAIRATQQCLKPCYIEGGAATTVLYVIDAPDRVYALRVQTGTSEKTEGLLREADAIVRTFRAE